MTARKKKERDPRRVELMHDLTVLASRKAGRAIGDAGQLLDDNGEVYQMSLAVICSLIASSACMLAGKGEKEGERRLTAAKLDRTMQAVAKALKESVIGMPPEGVKVE